jgi:gliding motility-associated-like protein
MKKIYTLPRGVFFLLLLTLGFTGQSIAQSGTDFWFAPPYVTHLHNPPGGKPIYLLLSSMGANASVTISQPANAGFTPIVIAIPASKSKRIDLSAFQTQLETTPTNTVLNTGLRIQATSPITANYEEDNVNNPEDFALKGANALGTDFYIPLTNFAGYPNNVFASPNQAIASFDIVAAQNGTVVTIYSPVPVDGHPALTQFSITLNAGQTYSCGWTGANYQLPSTHPAGAAVHSTKPVAITVKDDSDHNPSGGCYDLIGDQIIPITILGNEYVAVKGFLNNGGNESVFITATQNSTAIYLDGNPVPVITMFAGETFRIDMDSLPTAADNSIYIKATNPVYATHVTGFGCEMGSAILPPLNCAGSRQVNFVRSTNEAFYLTLLVHATSTGNFSITGPGTATIGAASFVTVPGTGGLWKAARIQYTTAQIPVDSGFSVTNSNDVFALGIINGGGATGCRYGYFSEFVAPIVVNAGLDQVVCANDTVQLSASITGGSTTGIWTSSGSGVFLPNNTTVNAQYVPSAADIATVNITLTLASTSICFPQQDQMLIKFTPAPTVNAGANQSICKNNPAITLNGTVTIATGGLWSGGAGTYAPNNTALNAVYTPTAAEIAAGTLVLTLTSTGNGTCHAVKNNTIITFTPAPVVNAGPDQTVCSNNANATLNGTVTGATSGVWSGGTGSFSPSATALNAVYSPSAAEISSGSLTLTLSSAGNGNCLAVTDQMVINFTLPPTANAGANQSICKNNSTVYLNGSVTIGTGGIWSGGLGTFAPSNTTLNASYSPTAAEIAVGSLTLTLTTTGNGKCNSASSQMVITFTPAPTVNAGASQTVCANNAAATLNGSVTLATGGIWSGGTGTYNPNNTTLNALYTPSAAEIAAGTATLTLTTTGNASCTAVSSNTTITITPAPTANAGVNQVLCMNNPNATLNGSVTVAGGGIWSGGAGSYSPNSSTLNAVYSPTAAEISSGSVTLTLSTTANGTCTPVTAQVKLSFTPSPTVNAGVDQTVCANNATVTLNGSVTTSTGAQWTGGLGTFSPNNNTLNATYAPTAAEIASGSVTLTLSSTGNGKCNAVTDQMTIFFTSGPTVNAGPDQTVCKNNAVVTLAGAVTVSTGGIWSGGAGLFTPGNTSLNATYTPTAAELAAGSVTLTLSTTGNGTCTAVSNSLNITYTPAPGVNAGPNQTLCSNNPNATLNGSVTTAGGGVWSGGAGSFMPSNTSLNAIYSPTAAEISSGSVTLTLTSTANGNCTAVTSQVKLSFTPSPTVNAGPDQTVCANNSTVALNGSVTTATGVQWSGGLGTFAPNSTTLNASYTPTATEISSGSVTLTLSTTGNGKCTAVTDQLIIFFTAGPTVNAGANQTTCKNNPVVSLSGAVTVSTGGIWSGGAGTYTPANTALNATYTPTAAELAAGTVTLTLTTTGNGTCTAITDNTVITYTPSPVVNAGADQSVCGNNPNVTLNGSVTNAGGGKWTGGAGSFSPSNTAMNAVYSPSAAEIASGSVTLTLSSTVNGTCNPVTDQMKINFTLPPTANAGVDRIVCANNATVSLNGAVTVASGGQWSGGLGTFAPNSSTLNAAYTPTAGEIAAGSVTLTLSTTGNGTCNAVSDQMLISFTTAPTASAGSNQTVCANNPTTALNGSFTGAAGILWTGGSGSYSPNNTSPTAAYTPSASEIAAGTVTLTLSTTGNGTCLPVSDAMTITLVPSPQVSAGSPIAACANKSVVTLGGIVLNAGGGKWTGGAGSFAPSATALNASYTPTAAEIASGGVTLTLTSTGNGSCNPVSSTVLITFAPAPSVNAGPDQTVCSNNSSVTLNGAVSNASGGVWSGGLGTFSPSATALNALYAPSQNEINSGLVKLVLSSSGNGTCNAVSDTMLIHFSPSPTVNAGGNLSSCANKPAVSLSGSYTVATGAVWSGGAGTYSPSATSMTATYTPSAAEIASGTVTLKLTSTGNGTCLPAIDSMLISIVPKPIVNAGPDQTVCLTSLNVPLSGSVSGSTNTGLWSSTGNGFFTPSSSALNATYHCSPQDSAAGFVLLVLTSTNNGSCNTVRDTLKINILPGGAAHAGTNTTVCGNNAVVVLNGSLTGSAASGTWSTNGTGAFSPNANTLNASYIPSAGDISLGSVKLTLTANSCNPASDFITVTISPAPRVNAGTDQTVCSTSKNIQLAGTVSGGTTTGIWTSSGTGSFVPNSSTLNAIYQASSADSAAQTIHLVLHSTNNGSCVQVTDTMLVHIYPSTTVKAGANQSVCSNKATVYLAGFVSGGGPGVWSTSGSGVFNPNANTLNATYSPSTTDISAGSVKLILTATSSCNTAVDFLVVTFTPAPTANAGPDQSVCGSNPNVTLAGAVVNAAGGIWTGGNGTFNPSSTALNATYTPTNAEISAGMVTLTLTTTGNGICNAVSDQVVLNFTSSIVANAGVDQNVCKSSANAQLQGIISNGSSTGIWKTLGSGTFSPSANVLNALYNFSSADTAAGVVTLVLSSSNNGLCAAASDTMKVFFGPNAFASAGVDQNTCSTNTLIQLNGLVSGGTNTGSWTTLGSGTFSPNAQSLNAGYTLSSGDISNGSVLLVLSTTNNGGCKTGRDTMRVVVNKPAIVIAGSPQSVCSNAVSVNLNGQVSGGSSTGKWSTNGAGTFSPSAQSLNATYTFGAADRTAGKIALVLTSLANGACSPVRDTVWITLQQQTVVNAGPDKTLCSSSPVAALNGLVTGGSTTGVWTSAGTGSFSPTSQTLNGTYTPGAADLAFGSVKLILSSTNTGLCPVTTDTVVLNFMKAPQANAGADQVLCSGGGVLQLNGSIAGGTTSEIWSASGTGTFSPNAQTLNATYTPGAADIAAGSVSLFLQTTNNGVCNQSSDTMKITIRQATVSNAGVDQNVCAANPVVNLNGLISGGTSSGVWSTLGSGTFSPSASTLNASYTPGASDVAGGKVKLVLTSTGNGPCAAVTDTLVITIHSAALVNAGPDQSSCGGSSIQLNGLVTGGGGTGTWTSSGTGAFVPNANALNATYVPSPADKGAGLIRLVLTSSTNGLCSAGTDTLNIHFGIKPLAAFTSVVNGTTATFSNQSLGAVTWLWNFGNSGGQSTVPNPSYQYSTSGTYTVTLIIANASGCADTTQARVVIEPTTTTVNPVAVPSGFTPNGDNVNDQVGILGGPFLESELTIYNAWGNVVFQSNDAAQGWDGVYHGVEQPAGVYIYTAKGKTVDGKVFNFSGDVTLIR